MRFIRFFWGECRALQARDLNIASALYLAEITILKLIEISEESSIMVPTKMKALEDQHLKLQERKQSSTLQYDLNVPDIDSAGPM